MGSGIQPISPPPRDNEIDASAEALAKLRRDQNRKRRSVADLIIEPNSQSRAGGEGLSIPGAGI
jgi:hypothetical protein